MKIKFPLRFFSKKFALPEGGRISHWLALAMLFLVVAFGFVSFYLLSIKWIKVEFSRAVSELSQKEAQRTSKAIVENLKQTLSSGDLTQSAQDSVTRNLSDLIRQNSNVNVVGVIISDALGHIDRVTLLPQATKSPTLHSLEQANPTLRGYSEAAVLNALAREAPNIQPISTSNLTVTRNGVPVAWGLTLLADRTIPTDAMNMAIANMTGWLTMLLGAIIVLVALAGLLIRRQQRIARRVYEQRSEVERLAYVGTLAAGLAHEIRNPLNALTMQLELLEEDVGEGAPQLVAPRLHHIRKGLAGVERTVHDFLTYATPGTQQPRMVELDSIIGPLCDEAIQIAPEVQVRMECAVPGNLQAWCDPHALRQILGNLISNALRAQKKKDGSGQLRVEASRLGPWIDILVDDAGPGVPEGQRCRIFDAFFTTTSDGTGLGLPIARRLTEMNGGQLTLLPETSPLGGARFRLRLSANPLATVMD